jgi:small conductance mechanosensitive channel
MAAALVLPLWAGVPAFAGAGVPPVPASALGVPAITLNPLSPIADQIGEQLRNLVGAPPAEADTAKPDAAKTSDADDSSTEIPPTFGTRALNVALNLIEIIGVQGRAFITSFAALPDISAWLQRQSADPIRLGLWTAMGEDMLLVVGLPLLIAVFIGVLLLRPLRKRINRHGFDSSAKRLAGRIGLFTLRLLPILVFLALSLALLSRYEAQKLPRFVILNVIYALTLNHIVLAVLRGVISPKMSELRLLPLTTPQARYVFRWISAFSTIIVCGYFCVDIARAVHMPPAVITAFENIFGFVLVVMTIIVIVQKRVAVDHVLRGAAPAADEPVPLGYGLRLWAAEHWHMLAIAYLVIGYSVTALGGDNRLAIMLQGTLGSVAVLAGANIAFAVLDGWSQRRAMRSSSAPHWPILRLLLRPAIWALALIGAAAAWGADIGALLATQAGQRISGAALSIGITVISLTLIYEAISTGIERHLHRRDASGTMVQASARARTLLPMLRNTAYILFFAITALVVLSEIGIDTRPFLAGAGILGVAIGFGAQTLVKDFLTGLFIVIENTIAVGDQIRIGDFFGTVEALSVRTLRLRDWDGSLHILPFSEVTKITNQSRGFSFAVMDIGVSYDSNLDLVLSVMREVGEALRQDPIKGFQILEPIDVMGVDQFSDSAIIIRARIRTQPGRQWEVRRRYLLQLKRAFDAKGIEIPYPHVTYVQKAAPDAMLPAADKAL